MEKEIKIIREALDKLKAQMKPKSLVGRYLRALKDGANGINVNGSGIKKGEIIQLKGVYGDCYYADGGYLLGVINHKEESPLWEEKYGFELLPEDYNPIDLSILKEGEWYEALACERWIFKFNSISEDKKRINDEKSCTPCDGYIDFTAGCIDIKDIKSLKLANMEEVKKFFPKEFEIKYVKCLNISHDFTLNRIYTFPNPYDDKGSLREINILNGSVWKFEPATKQEYDNQCLLDEAKRRYHVGSKFVGINGNKKVLLTPNCGFHINILGSVVIGVYCVYKDGQ